MEFPGAWYHLTARGNERRAIFRSDRDRERFLDLLGECRVRFGLRIHAYVLMTNHYHLIVETAKGQLSRALHWLNVSYTVWFNRRHRRSGHLFQGRFKGILLEVEEHGAALSRYVHLNPVRLVRFGLGKKQRAQTRAGLGGAATREEVLPQSAITRQKNLPSQPATGVASLRYSMAGHFWSLKEIEQAGFRSGFYDARRYDDNKAIRIAMFYSFPKVSLGTRLSWKLRFLASVLRQDETEFRRPGIPKLQFGNERTGDGARYFREAFAATCRTTAALVSSRNASRPTQRAAASGESTSRRASATAAE